MRMSDSDSSYDEIWDIMWENGNADDEAGTTLLDNGNKGDEPLAKKPEIANDLNEVTIDEHLEAIEEAALKELITLVYLLYDKEDLYRMGNSHMVIDQQNKFWEELAPIGEKYYRGEEYVKSTIDDDILKAIRKVKLCPRLTVDQYTVLLIEMFTDRDMKCQEFLIAKAVEIIDIETLYSLDAHTQFYY